MTSRARFYWSPRSGRHTLSPSTGTSLSAVGSFSRGCPQIFTLGFSPRVSESIPAPPIPEDMLAGSRPSTIRQYQSAWKVLQLFLHNRLVTIISLSLSSWSFFLIVPHQEEISPYHHHLRSSFGGPSLVWLPLGHRRKTVGLDEGKSLLAASSTQTVHHLLVPE